MGSSFIHLIRTDSRAFFLMAETSARGWCTGMTQKDGTGREVEGGVHDGEHMKIHGWFISMYGKNHYNIVK